MKTKTFITLQLVVGLFAICLAPPLARGQVTDSGTMANIPVYKQGTTIASAATTNLGTATGDFVDVSGTTTITALGTAMAGRQVVVRFTGILTLTHHATSLILPAAANITTAANDCAIFRSLGSGNWICVSYSPGAGGSGATLSGAETLTNKTIDLANNTVTATSANLITAITNETGTGVAVFNTSPTLVTPVIGAATGTSLTLTGGVIQGIQTISGDGAITIAPGIVRLTKGSIAAITLAAPSSNDGVVITIMSTTDFAHVVTVTGGMWDGTATTNTTVTFPVVAGAAVTLMASGTDWYVLNNQGTTIAP
jgi:hypothetical protein